MCKKCLNKIQRKNNHAHVEGKMIAVVENHTEMHLIRLTCAHCEGAYIHLIVMRIRLYFEITMFDNTRVY